MLTKPINFITDFCMTLKERYNIDLDPGEISHERCKAPIQFHQLNLHPGKGAVYIFSLIGKSKASAGPNRVLKVGKVGPRNLKRFRYEHYKLGPSTLAGSIRMLRILWTFIGINSNINQQFDFGQWLIQNTDRDHFHMPKITLEGDGRILLLGSFEYYLKGILGPVFEG